MRSHLRVTLWAPCLDLKPLLLLGLSAGGNGIVLQRDAQVLRPRVTRTTGNATLAEVSQQGQNGVSFACLKKAAMKQATRGSKQWPCAAPVRPHLEEFGGAKFALYVRDDAPLALSVGIQAVAQVQGWLIGNILLDQLPV